jgi:hypothetical protein
MRSHSLTRSIRTRLPAALAIGFFILFLSARYSRVPAFLNAPTVFEDPLAIDQAWQKGSAKYDAPRAAILTEVDRAGQLGPSVPTGSRSRNTRFPNGTRT